VIKEKNDKMKTNKQQSVMLMLLVLPITLTIVTTTTKYNSTKAMTGESRDRDGGEMSK
jgi:hypothetical protein